MKLRLMGLKEDLQIFTQKLAKLEQQGDIQVISISNPYANRNSLEYRLYCEIRVLNQQLLGVKK